LLAGVREGRRPGERHAPPVGREGEGLRVDRTGVEGARLAAAEAEQVDAWLAVLLAQEGQRRAVR
jgi:hypothetical protein